MRRPFLIGLLALGTVLGFGSGFAHLHYRAMMRRQAFEERVAGLCVNAARQANAAAVPTAPVAAAPSPAPAPATVNPTTIYVVPSLAPAYPVAAPVPSAVAPSLPAPAPQPIVSSPAPGSPSPGVSAPRP